MCECEKQLTEKLTEKLKEMYPEGEGHHVNLPGYALILSSPSRWVGKMPIEMSVALPLRKNPEFRKVKKIKQSMFFSYCPFCGESCEPAAAKKDLPEKVVD